MRSTRQIILYGGGVALAGATGVALAQAAPLPPTGSWFLSPVEWAGVVALVTQFAKTTFKWTGNTVVYFAFGFSVAGAILAATGALSVLNIILDASVIEAIIFGVSAGAIAAGGYDVVTTLIEKGRSVTVNAPTIATDSAVVAEQRVVAYATGNPITDFIVMLAQQAVGALNLPKALIALLPLLSEFSQSSAVLTDDLRSDLQGRVIRVLRDAGLVGVDL